jgi:hypothetical protein
MVSGTFFAAECVPERSKNIFVPDFHGIFSPKIIISIFNAFFSMRKSDMNGFLIFFGYNPSITNIQGENYEKVTLRNRTLLCYFNGIGYLNM